MLIDLPKLQALYDVRHLMLVTHNQLSVLSDVQLSLWSTLVLAQNVRCILVYDFVNFQLLPKSNVVFNFFSALPYP